MQRRSWRRFWTDPQREIDEELAFHMEMREAEAREHGLSEADSRQEARRAFGDRVRIEKELQRIGRRRAQRLRRSSMLSGLRIDLVQSVRSFAKRPGLPALIVVTLGLCIGATTAVYTLFDAVVLRPLPIPESSKVHVLEPRTQRGVGMPGVAFPLFRALREAGNGWTVAGSLFEQVTLHAGEFSDRRGALIVSGNYFEMLGVRAQAGRLLRPSDEQAMGAAPFVVVSDGLWRRAFGGAPDAIGKTLRVNGQPFEVVGIAPRNFRGTNLRNVADVWIPVSMIHAIGNGGLLSSPDILTTDAFSFFALTGRLAAGEGEARATERLRSHFRHLEADSALTMHTVPVDVAATGRSRADLLRFMTVLWSVVGLCLAIGCVNVANLLLLRANVRWRELAVRMSLGASRARVFRQVLMEGLVLGVSGGALAIIVSFAGTRLLAAYSLPGEIALHDIPLGASPRVLAFALGLSLFCALLFSAAPAFQAARPRLMDAIVEMRQGAERRAHRPDGLLVSLQVALSLVLVVGALLFTRSLHTALDTDLGFDARGVASLTFSPRAQGHNDSTGTHFRAQVLEAARAQVGERVALATQVPQGSGIALPIQPLGPGARRHRGPVGYSAASPGFFALLGVRFVAGRDFSPGDRGHASTYAILTETTARTFWPGQSALGQKLRPYPGSEDEFVVIGIIEDTRFDDLSKPTPHVFISTEQKNYTLATERVSLVARSGQSTQATLTRLRNAVRAVDPQMPVWDAMSIEDQIDRVLVTQRFGMRLLLLFGAIACAISTIGIYAVATFDVARRKRELGIRSALGATAAQLSSAVLTRIARAVIAGTAAGLILSAFLTGSLRRFLFGITPYEPVSYGIAALIFGLVAVSAAWLPLRKAKRADPLVLIRD